MPWIQNVSLAAAISGLHYFDPGKTVLIRIMDRGTMTWPDVLYQDKFVDIFKFDFDDEEDWTNPNVISQPQAAKLANILTWAKNQKLNIVVHCHAGLCRSGAVAECGHLIGFQDVEEIRIPNVLVKTRIRHELGFSHTWEEVK